MKYLMTLLVCFSWAAQAETEIGFDEIVNDLTRSRSPLRTATPTSSWEDIQIHLGIGVTNGVFSLQHPDGTNTQANQRGVQVNLGIDLFNPNLIAEGSIMSFLERDYDNVKVGLQEFDLKLIYKDALEAQLGYHLGGGLAARYLTVTPRNGGEEMKYTTPAWLAVAGLDVYFAKGLSLGGEIVGRGSLTNETPDQSSMDFALRLDAHF